MKINCAIVQMNSGSDRAKNLDRAGDLARKAAGSGAEIVALPENFAFMRKGEENSVAGESLYGPTITRAREISAQESIFLLAGSFPERSTTPGKVYNTSVLLGPRGRDNIYLPEDPSLRRKDTGRRSTSRIKGGRPRPGGGGRRHTSGPNRINHLLRPTLRRVISASRRTRGTDLSSPRPPLPSGPVKLTGRF